jgi:hypothetical protein
MDRTGQYANEVHINSPSNAPGRPTPPTPNWAGVHPTLIKLVQWVLWRYVLKQTRDGHKWTKVPFQVNGRAASSVDEKTWNTFQQCKEAYENQTEQCPFDGIGFVTSKDDPYVLLDLDHVLHPNMMMDNWSQDIVDAAKSEGGYIEISVGGDGIHIIGLGPQGFSGKKKNAAEAYCHSRFFTVSGNSLDLKPEIGSVTKTLDLVLEQIGCSLDELLGNSEPSEKNYVSQIDQAAIGSTNNSVAADDVTLLNKARSARNGEKFARLFDDGDVSGHNNDDSSADLALASMLAFWTGPDPSRIEKLMRLSKLRRDKWDIHHKYLSMTIKKALKDMKPDNFYDWTNHTPTLSAVRPPAILGLNYDHKEKLITNVNNAIIILQQDPDLAGLVKYDEFADRLTITQPIPDKTGNPDTRKYPRIWEDGDSIALQAYFQRHQLPKVTLNIVQDALEAFKSDCSFHPVKDYLESLIWDGTPRIDDWLVKHANADLSPGTEYLAQVGSKFLISAVARIYKPGCKVDHMLVLEGDQGAKKSTALNVIAGSEWFSDSLPSDLNHKDTTAHLKGKWIIEMSELSQFHKSQIETVKAYLTRCIDKYRPPYGRYEIEAPRQCVFSGSTNSDCYLVDTTGNRRFWVVKVGRIDIDGLRLIRDQLWAEAVFRFKRGEVWHLTDESLVKTQVEEAKKRTTSDPWTISVAEVLDKKSIGDAISPGEVLNLIPEIKPSDKHKVNASRVAVIMSELGWSKFKRHSTRGQLYTKVNINV